MAKFPKSISRQDISERIVFFRENIASLTQTEFAAKAGVSARALQTYEQGTADVSSEFCKRAFDAFGLDPVWLLAGQGAPESQVGRGGAKPLAQIAYEAVDEAVSNSGQELTRTQKGWLVQAVYEHLVKANGDLKKIDIPLLMRLRPA